MTNGEWRMTIRSGSGIEALRLDVLRDPPATLCVAVRAGVSGAMVTNDDRTMMKPASDMRRCFFLHGWA